MRDAAPRGFLRVLVPALAAVSGLARADQSPTFENDVRPIFVRRCTVCHNAAKAGDAEISGGLALDTYEGAIKGTPRRKILAGRDVAASTLFARLTDKDDELRMPRDDDPLPESERSLIRRWIEAGAPRGERKSIAATKGAVRRIVRSLDVALPFERPGATPKEKPVAGEIKLKVGPLPAATALSFRPDGKRLALGSYGRVVIWDVDKRGPTAIVSEFPGTVSALLFFEGGRKLVAAGGLPGRSGAIRICDAETGATLRELEGHAEVVTAVAVRPDGGRLASASFDQTVRFWDLSGKTPVKIFKGHSDFVNDVAYLPDGKSVLSVSRDRSVKRIDADTAKEIKTYSDHNEPVLAVAVRPDGKEFATAGEESAMRIWTLDGDKPTKRLGGHNGPIHQLAIAAKGGLLVSASGDKSARVFKTAGWTADRTLAGVNEWQYAVACDESGRLAAAGGWDGVVRIWDLGAKSPKPTLVLIAPPPASPADAAWLSLSADGRVAASPDLAPLVRRFESGKELPALSDKGAKK